MWRKALVQLQQLVRVKKRPETRKLENQWFVLKQTIIIEKNVKEEAESTPLRWEGFCWAAWTRGVNFPSAGLFLHPKVLPCFQVLASLTLLQLAGTLWSEATLGGGWADQICCSYPCHWLLPPRTLHPKCNSESQPLLPAKLFSGLYMFPKEEPLYSLRGAMHPATLNCRDKLGGHLLCYSAKKRWLAP